MATNTKDYIATTHAGVKIHRGKDQVDFLLDFRIDGKRYYRRFKANPVHTSKDRLDAAYEARKAAIKEIKHDNNIDADVDATVGDYWVKLKKVSGWRDQLIKKYDYYFNKHFSKLATMKVRDVKPAHLTSLNVSLSHLAPRTQLEGYEILKPLFLLAVEDEIIDKSPIKRSHVPKRKQIEEKKIVTDAESKYRLVYEAINTLFGTEQKITTDNGIEIQCHDNPHHRAAFLFGFHGRRLQETLNLRWEDINFEQNSYVIRGVNSKVNTDMEFTLPADVMEALYEFRAANGMVFNVKSLDRHHQKIRDYTGIPEFTFHWMRNLTVSALAAMGADITHLSAMLGHNDSSTIKKYLSLQRKTSTGKMGEISRKLLES